MLRRLELKNFRNYDHLVLDLAAGGRTLLIGENGRGKSTIVDAIQWVLTGRCRGVDGKGAGQKDLIRLGADDMQVTAVWDELGPVTRSISRAGSATASMPTETILAKLGVTQGMLEGVLAGRAFFTMHHTDAKDLLMRLLNVRIPKDQLPGVDLPDSVADVDLGYLDQLFDAAFADRAALKKALAGAFVPDAPKVVSIDLGGKTLVDVQRQLARDQNAMLQGVKDHAKSEQNLASLKEKKAAAERLIAGRPALDGNRTSHQDMLTKHEAELTAAQAAVRAAEAEQTEPVGALEVQLREAASLIDKIERHTQAVGSKSVATPKGKKKIPMAAGEPHACVLSADIPCLTAISEFQGQVDQLKAAHTSLEGRIRAGNERAGRIAAAGQAVKESERHVTYHQGQIRDIAAKIDAAEAAQASLADLTTGIDALEAAVAISAKSIADWRADVTRQQDQLAELATYEQAQKTHAAAVQRKADLEDQVKKAEAVVDLLGPKGVRLTYLDQALGDFQLAINAALEPFGFSLAINVEPWRIEVDNGQGVLRFEMLSEGQKLWTGLAFQITLAALSGLDFCVLDSAETVVGTNRAVLTELILGAPVRQVLVAMAKGDEEPAPDIDGLQVLRVGQAGDLVGV